MTEIIPGEVVQFTDLVRRITAPNPGPMTGPGTNTYLVGTEQVAVVDPGPAEQSHIDAILAAGNGCIQWILVTHSHSDHSPAARQLAEATGAIVMGNKLSENDGFQDDSFTPGHCFIHNETLNTEQFVLRAVLTPGHVDNHICYLLEEQGVLFTGDHIMQGSTVVIVPPYGDMKDYIDSLTLLNDYSINSIAPGHGCLIENPGEEIDRLIKHRLRREAKVVNVISEQQQGSLASLTPYVYDDVDPSLHSIAKYSLWAHLIKLEKEHRVTKNGDEWLFRQ